MNKYKLLVCALVVCQISFTQVKLDIELVGGTVLNGKQYDFEYDESSFNLKNGFSYGLGFDLKIKEKWSVSFGYSLGQSWARYTTIYPEDFIITKSIRSIGMLKDRIIHLGAKRSFKLWRSGALDAFAGFYYNPFFFDSDDVDGSGWIEQNETHYYQSEHYYARFNSTNFNFSGAYGGRLGIGLSQTIKHIGTFSMSLTYNADFLRNLNQLLYAQNTYLIWDGVSNEYDVEYTNGIFESVEKGRNFWQFQIGFKMPCSILLKDKEPVKNEPSTE